MMAMRSGSYGVSGALAWWVLLATCSMALALQWSRVSAAAQPRGPAPLVQKSDLVYTGAFRLPAPSGEKATFEWGGTALTYWPAHDSLLVVGHDWYQRVAEVNIPTAAREANVADLPRAILLQPHTDILQGKLNTIDGNTSNGVKIGGITPVGNSLVVSAWSYYDAGVQKQTRSHFVTGQNFSALGLTTGPFQVGRGFQDIVPSDTTRIAGFVSGYMAPIPRDWQAALGGTHLTGQGGMISILGRTSAGPSASVFTPADLGVAVPAPAKILMGYPIDGFANSPLNHPTLGQWGQNGGLYNGSQGFRGLVFPDGTRSILFFGWGGETFCYGTGTTDSSLHLRPNPKAPGTHFCYDPTPGKLASLGTHAYPLSSVVFAYDVNDFIAVRQGQKQPWDVKPYMTWNFELPFQSQMVNGIETGAFEIQGATYDPATRRLFVSAYRSDGPSPLIHVFILKNALTLF
jgi:hypothetical protein